MLTSLKKSLHFAHLTRITQQLLMWRLSASFLFSNLIFGCNFHQFSRNSPIIFETGPKIFAVQFNSCFVHTYLSGQELANCFSLFYNSRFLMQKEKRRFLVDDFNSCQSINKLMKLFLFKFGVFNSRAHILPYFFSITFLLSHKEAMRLLQTKIF